VERIHEKRRVSPDLSTASDSAHDLILDPAAGKCFRRAVDMAGITFDRNPR